MQIPAELKSLETEILQNVALPLFAENMGNVQSMAQSAQEGSPEEQGMEQGQEMPQEGMEQEQQVPGQEQQMMQQ